MMLRTAFLTALLSVLPLAGFAQKPVAPAPTTDPLAQSFVMPEAPKGTVPWTILQQAKTVQKPDKKFGPEFTRDIKALDHKDVKLFGFMMPLDQARLQKRFLLAAYPPHCAFCLPSGPESLVEVVCDKGVEFTMEPIVVSGRMAVLENDVVYYRLTNASAVQP
jgi:hypothetical protein